MDDTAAVLQWLLLAVLLPMWMLAGFADWLCHRVQRIEHTAGTPESLLHWLLLAELGTGIAAGLLLQPNAAVLALLAACCVAHEITTWCDLAYAASRRRIPPMEQWVHGVQMALPWVGLATLLVIQRDQALALVGHGGVAADWGLRWKQPPVPPAVLLAVLAGVLMFVLLPFAEELIRCRRARAGAQ